MKKRGLLRLIISLMLSVVMAVNTPVMILAQDSGEEVVESQEEAAEPQEEAAEAQEPAAEPQEPVVQSQEPVAEAQEPVAEAQEPVVESQEPAAESNEPAVESQEEAAESQAPVVESQGVVVEPQQVEELQGSAVILQGMIDSLQGSAVEPAAAGVDPGVSAPADLNAVTEGNGTDNDPSTETAPAVQNAQAQAAAPSLKLAGPVVTGSDAVTSTDPAPKERKVDPNNTDAEKYSGDTENYDQYLCWAATAANMLWIAQVAQQAVNPLTGDYFRNEDEVFNYFRRTFTDKTGWMDGALYYFTDNYYKYKDDESAPQIKPDAPEGGLIEGGMQDGQYGESYQEEKDIFEALGDFVKKSVGLGVQFWDGTEAIGGHAITLIELVKGELEGTYKGVWVADSDNDTPYSKGQRSDDDDERALLASQMDNAYTYYPLSYQEIDNKGYWILDDYSDDFKTVIQFICWLNETRPVDDDDDDDDDDAEESGSDVKPAVVQPEDSPVITVDEEQIARAYEVLKSLMSDKGIVIVEMEPEKAQSTVSKQRSFVVRRIMTTLLNVYVDGKRLSANGTNYTLTKNPEGLFTITLTDEFVRTLSSGHHTLTLDFGGNDVDNIDFEIN